MDRSVGRAVGRDITNYDENLIHISQSLRLTFHHILKRGTAHYVGLIEYTSPNFVGFHEVYGFHEYDIAHLLCFLHICLIKNLINILYSY